MNFDEADLRQALRAMAEAGPDQAPEFIGQRLTAEFRRAARRRRTTKWWAAAGAVAAAAGVAIVLLAAPGNPPGPAPHWSPAAPPSTALAPLAASAGAPAPVATPVRMANRARRVRPASAARPEEIASRFYPLPGAGTLPDPEETAVVRMRLPRSAMLFVGLPVNEERAAERVQADVVFGQDGVARAVRFVQ